MTWSVESLFGLSGIEFEIERCRIISDYLKTLSPAAAERARLFQADIDGKRREMSPEAFSAWLWMSMSENMENTIDQFGHVKQIIGDLK
jgi:hypothetical protein